MKPFETIKDFENLKAGDMVLHLIKKGEYPFENIYLGLNPLDRDEVLLQTGEGCTKHINSYHISMLLGYKKEHHWYYDVSVADYHSLLKEYSKKELAHSTKVVKENKNNHIRINFDKDGD